MVLNPKEFIMATEINYVDVDLSSLGVLRKRVLEARAKRLKTKLTSLLDFQGIRYNLEQEVNDVRAASQDPLIGGEELVVLVEKRASEAV